MRTMRVASRRKVSRDSAREGVESGFAELEMRMVERVGVMSI
jgi:hypothetical protein